MSIGVGSSSALTPRQESFAGLKKQVAAYVQGSQLTSVLADAGYAINAAIDKLNTRGWHWLNRTEDITLEADTRTYTVAADFKKPFALLQIDSDSKEQGRIYYQMPKQFLDTEWSESSSGQPEFYTVRNVADDRLLTLSYAPDSVFVAKYPTLRLHYYGRLQHLSDDGDTLGDIKAPPEIRNFLVWHARWEIASMRGSRGQQEAAERAWRMEWRNLIADDNDIQTDWSVFR